ncbi:MAG: DUF89 family protein [Chitinispirillaceae bacterium]|nr:DUF89 family protein [Chitinispirillaceae bacterium]
MKLFPDCYPCVLRQVLSLVKLTGMDDLQTKLIMDEAMKMLLATSGNDSPQRIIVGIGDFVRNMIHDNAGPFDPYAGLKEKSNAAVLRHFDDLEAAVKQSASPLETAIRQAAAGNIIDFGAKDHGSIDIAKEIRDIPSLRFSFYDYEPLLYKMKNARLLLCVGDNAGEIVFDRILIRQIKREFPGLRIVFATRDKPVINDVTPEDAYRVGLDKEAEIISSGCRYPGLMLEETNEIFRELFKNADLVIAKGQGNYEGLSEIDDERLFFIMRIKCERVAKHIGAEVGGLVLRQKTKLSGPLQ